MARRNDEGCPIAPENMKWVRGDIGFFCTICDIRYRITTRSQGVGSMGLVMALERCSVSDHPGGWAWMGCAWYQTDGGYHTWAKEDKVLYPSKVAAITAMKRLAAYLVTGDTDYITSPMPEGMEPRMR